MSCPPPPHGAEPSPLLGSAGTGVGQRLPWRRGPIGTCREDQPARISDTMDQTAQGMRVWREEARVFTVIKVEILSAWPELDMGFSDSCAWGKRLLNSCLGFAVQEKAASLLLSPSFPWCFGFFNFGPREFSSTFSSVSFQKLSLSRQHSVPPAPLGFSL